jgi:hypothetical protein
MWCWRDHDRRVEQAGDADPRVKRPSTVAFASGLSCGDAFDGNGPGLDLGRRYCFMAW